MNRRTVCRTALGGLAVLFCVASFLPEANSKEGLKAKLTPTAELGGEERYRVHLSTDKPIYRAGEKVYLRAVILNAFDRKPYPRQTTASVQITGPKGETVASGNAGSQDSVVGFAWPVGDGAAGGEYKAKMTFPWDGLSPAERTFEIRAYRPPRLKSQTVFMRDGYGPGDTVQATLHTERAEGGIPIGAKVTPIARVDGKEIYRGSTRVDAEGNCTTKFKLPKKITRGQGTLAWVIEDGGVVETASKTIPILLQTIDIKMFPEGGDLVAGLPSRVYVEARTPSQKPADLEGVIKDDNGFEVTQFKTTHDGRGWFSLQPVKGRTYHLEVTKPSGIAKSFKLPKAKAKGVVIGAVEDVTAPKGRVWLRIGKSHPGQVWVTLSQKERIVASTQLTFSKKKGAKGSLWPGRVARRSFEIPKTVNGVLVATVWDNAGNPLAERLVFRKPAERLEIEIQTNRKTHVPGSPVELSVRTTDQRGRPVSAVVGLTVTDESVLEMIDTRDQAPRLPVMVFLEDEVKELADAHVYLDEKNPKSQKAVDLLLGTQGWRRFIFHDAVKSVAEHGDHARRALALQVRSRREMVETKRQALGGRRPARAMIPQAPPMPVKAAPAKPEPPKPRARVQPRAKPKPKPAPARRSARRMEQPSVVGPMDGMAHGKMAKAMDMAAEAEMEDRLIAEEPAKQQAALVWVREYAHQARANRKKGDRVDFTETVYWSSAVKTDESGVATVKFSLSDSVTAFRVMADGFDNAGRIGSGTGSVESVEPFYLEPKVPLVVSSGDQIRLPVALVNGTAGSLRGGSLSVKADKGIRVKGAGGFTLGADERKRQLVDLSMGSYVGTTNLVLAASIAGHGDKVTKTLEVQPLGYPMTEASGGMLEPGGTVSMDLNLPQQMVSGSVITEVAVYPTPLANLTQALTRLMREPNGCFEQTSSTNYPLVMAQQYFMSHTGVDPELVQKSRTLLKKGYDRLVSFETPKKGYEWFGQAPGHEALSAFGLMEFNDMASVMQVDTAMIGRTKKWLMGQRNGKGGFTSGRRALHTWLVDPDMHTGYITWALLESGERKLGKEVKAIKEKALSSNDSYVVALGANAAALSGDKTTAKRLMKTLVSKQTKDGWVDGASTSIVGSRGDALKIETTALATLAWLRDDSFAGSVEKSIRFLTQSCEGGRYGSTQSTVLALKAIVEYDKARAKPKKAGSLQLLVDGKAVGSPVGFDKKTHGAITLPVFADRLGVGKHTVAIRMSGGAKMPYSMSVRYNTLQPASSPEARVYVRTALRDRKITEGNVTEIEVNVFNTTDEPLPTPVAIIGVPGGLEVRHDQLKELKRAGRIAAYEVMGRDVVLYWRELTAKQKVSLPISLIAAVPGTYTGPASRSYEYYADEFKQWAPGLKVEIAPK